MDRPLDSELRVQWDALVTIEGEKLGLSDCKAFLENKLVNDIFYEGRLKGVPCVVKCSSRAPESMANEFLISKRLMEAAPVCAEALSHWISSDGRMAFVVTRKLPGPSLTDIIADGVDEDEAIGALEDMLRIADALCRTGIVWRDIIPDNFLMDDEGHLRLIDAQFAVDRNDFHEAPYLLSHWKYRTLLFAHHPMMAGHGWNDVAMMAHFARCLVRGEHSRARFDRLCGYIPQSAFPRGHDSVDYMKMAGLYAYLQVRRHFSLDKRKREVMRQRCGRAARFLTGDKKW